MRVRRSVCSYPASLCLVVVRVVVAVGVRLRVRTGLWVPFSTAGLAGVAAAGLQVADLDPGVAQAEAQLGGQGHRLPPVGEEAAESRVHGVKFSGDYNVGAGSGR